MGRFRKPFPHPSKAPLAWFFLWILLSVLSFCPQCLSPWASAGPLFCLECLKALSCLPALLLNPQPTGVVPSGTHYFNGLLGGQHSKGCSSRPHPQPLTPVISHLQGLVHPDPLTSSSLLLGSALPSNRLRPLLALCPCLEGLGSTFHFCWGFDLFRQTPITAPVPRGWSTLNGHCRSCPLYIFNSNLSWG